MLGRESQRCQDLPFGGVWLQTLARGDGVRGWKVSEAEAGLTNSWHFIEKSLIESWSENLQGVPKVVE